MSSYEDPLYFIIITVFLIFGAIYIPSRLYIYVCLILLFLQAARKLLADCEEQLENPEIEEVEKELIEERQVGYCTTSRLQVILFGSTVLSMRDTTNRMRQRSRGSCWFFLASFCFCFCFLSTIISRKQGASCLTGVIHGYAYVINE